MCVVCGFTSAMTSSGGARLKAVVVAIACRFRFSWLRSAPATASASGSASATAVGRVQFAAILKIVHQNPQSNLLRCFMTVLRAADFTPLKTTAQPTHNTHTHTTHTPIRNTHFTCKSCINFCRRNTNNNKVTHCRVAHWSCG